jgi:hypothetical protein
MARNISVMGIYSDRKTVSDAVSVLGNDGFWATDIAVLCTESQGTRDFAHEKHTKAFQGAAIGAAVGAFAGASLAWLISAQHVSIPDLSILTSAGPVLAALAGAGAGGALGWIVGVLAGARLPEYIAKRYAGRIRFGNILMSVHCDSPEWSKRAVRTLRDTGARGISALNEAAADYGMTSRPTPRIPPVVSVLHEMPVEPEAEYAVVETTK